MLRSTEDEQKAIGMLERMRFAEARTRWISLSPVNGGLIRPERASRSWTARQLNVPPPWACMSTLSRGRDHREGAPCAKVAKPVRRAVRGVPAKYGLDLCILPTPARMLLP